MRVESGVAKPSLRVVPKFELDTPMVLVVEADQRLRAQLCYALQSDGHEVLGLRDGSALLEYYQSAACGPAPMPDVIVAGVERPEAKVLEACEQIHKVGAKIPVVLLQPNQRADLYEACERVGGIFFFDQPLDFDRLRSAVWGLTQGPC